MSRKYFVMAVGLVAIFILTACGVTSERADQVRVNDQQSVYSANQPIPYFDWSLERQLVTQLYEIRNRAVNTWAVVVSNGTGMALWSCPSFGYPIPYDTSLTNPLQPVYSNGAVVEMAEPNGLFPSKNSDATWVMCIGNDGKANPVYAEAKVIVFPFPVRVTETGQIVRIEGQQASVEVDVTRPTTP